MFKAQRNMYLTGFTLFLSYALTVFLRKQKRIVDLEKDIMALK